MASLNMAFGMAATRGIVLVAKASKSGGSVEEEKGLLDWLMGALQKQDQLLETDPLLNKVENKSASKTTSSVSIPNKKKPGGFGGLFAKN